MTRHPESGALMLILDYMEKGNLDAFIENKDNDITWKDKYLLLQQILQNLTRIHYFNYVHKDIHPGNILCGEQGWFIGDFGISGPAYKKKDNEVVGVIPYIAPEVLRGEK